MSIPCVSNRVNQPFGSGKNFFSNTVSESKKDYKPEPVATQGCGEVVLKQGEKLSHAHEKAIKNAALPEWFADMSPALKINVDTGEITGEQFVGNSRASELCGFLRTALCKAEEQAGVSPNDRSYATNKTEPLYSQIKEDFLKNLASNPRAMSLMRQLEL